MTPEFPVVSTTVLLNYLLSMILSYLQSLF